LRGGENQGARNREARTRDLSNHANSLRDGRFNDA
jgi:hypothetical protein